MDYLLDTTTISYVMDNQPAVMRRFERLYPSDHVYTSVVNEAELLYGALRRSGTRGRELLSSVRQFLDRLDDVLPITREVAGTYADLRQRQAARGRLMPVNDLWIAAVAVTRNLTLAAHDKDFHDVSGLRVEDWLQP